MNGDVVEWDKDNILVKTDAIALTQVSMHNYTMDTVTEDSSCTEMETKLSGCYNCLAGAIIHYNCSTDFGEQTVTADCGSFQILIECSKLKRERWSLLQYNKGTVDLNCIIKCPANELKFKLQGQLEDIDEDEDERQPHNEHSSKDQGIVEEIVNWMKDGLLNFIHEICLFIVIIGFIIVIYYVFKCCFKFAFCSAVASVLYYPNTEF